MELELNSGNFFHTIDHHDLLKGHMACLEDVDDRRTFFTDDDNNEINQVFVIKKAHRLNTNLGVSFSYNNCSPGVEPIEADNKDLEVLLIYKIANELVPG